VALLHSAVVCVVQGLMQAAQRYRPRGRAAFGDGAVALAAWAAGTVIMATSAGWESGSGVGLLSTVAAAAASLAQAATRPQRRPRGRPRARGDGTDADGDGHAYGEAPSRAGEATLAASAAALLIGAVLCWAVGAWGVAAAASLRPPHGGPSGAAHAPWARLGPRAELIRLGLTPAAPAAESMPPSLERYSQQPTRPLPAVLSPTDDDAGPLGDVGGEPSITVAPPSGAASLAAAGVPARVAALLAAGVPPPVAWGQTAFAVAAVEVAGAAVTALLALPFLATQAHAVVAGGKNRGGGGGGASESLLGAARRGHTPAASSGAGSGAAKPPRVGVPSAARGLRLLGLQPPGPGWAAPAAAVAVSLVAWDLAVGWAVLGSDPVSWLGSFLAEPPTPSSGPAWDAYVAVSGPLARALAPVGSMLRGAPAGSAQAGTTPPPTADLLPLRLGACALWALMVPAQALLARLAGAAGAPRTVVRKCFHLAAAAMLGPVIAADPALAAVAGAGALRLFAALEALRSAGVPVLGAWLSSAVAPFVDERDGGGLVLTHAYLLGGCLLPVWLLPMTADVWARAAAAPGGDGDGAPSGRWAVWSLLPQAGVIAVALSDAASAAVGRSVGRWQWPHAAPKTVEGTAAGAAAGAAAVLVIAALVPPPPPSFIAAAASSAAALPSAAEVACGIMVAVLTSLHETFTGLIDNAASPAFATALTAGAGILLA